MIRTSESIAELSESLVKAQAKFASAIKDAQNPQYRSKYADLTSVIAAMVPHLNSEGLAVMQHPQLEFKGEGDTREAFVTVTTRIQHKTGQFMESDLSVPAVQRERFDAQSVGSAITYACRYGLQSIGVLGREDDDGTQAVGGGTSEEAQKVGAEKIAKLKQKAAPEPSNSQASLFYALQPSGLYAVQGDTDLMRKLYKQFSKEWYAQDKCYMVSENQLEVLKFECEQGGIPLAVLKGPKA
jgi:hypothetical protein